MNNEYDSFDLNNFIRQIAIRTDPYIAGIER